MLASPGQAAAASAHRACFAVYGNEIRVVDIEDPAAPHLGARVTGLPPGAGFDVEADHLYIASESGGLQVYDLTDVDAPLLLGQTADSVRGAVAADGDRVVVVDRAAGELVVVDVANPTDPRIASRTAVDAGDIDLQSDLAYISTADGLSIISIADPLLPTVIGREPTAQQGKISVSGTLACIGTSDRLQVIDISNNAAPTLAGQVAVDCADVVLDGTIASVIPQSSNPYLWGRMQLVDLEDPATPQLAGRVGLPGAPTSLAVTGGHAFVTLYWTEGHYDFSQLVSVDVSVAGSPPPLGSIPVGAVDLEARELRAFLLTYGELAIYDVADPARATLLGELGIPPCSQLAVNATHAFLVDGNGGQLRIADISNPSRPAMVSDFDTPGPASDVAVQGTRLFLADGLYSGLHILDISNPRVPRRTSSLYLPASRVWVQGNRLYVSGGASFSVLDIANPDAPVVLGSLAMPLWAVDGNRGCSIGGGGLTAIDLTDPRAPRAAGSVSTPYFDTYGQSIDVTLSGPYAYVTMGTLGLAVVDLTNIDSPVLLGGTSSNAAGRAVVSGERVFVLGSSVEILPAQCGVATPAVLTDLVATIEANGIRVGWHVHDPAAFAGIVLQRAEGEDPRRWDWRVLNPGGAVPTRDPSSFLDRDVEIGTVYAYQIVGSIAAGGTARLGPVLARWSGEPQRRLLEAWPNPSHAITTLRIAVPPSSRSRLRVFDLGGRVVRDLWNVAGTSGSRLVSWDGRDDSGRLVASGTYVARLDWPGGSASTRMTRLR